MILTKGHDRTSSLLNMPYNKSSTDLTGNSVTVPTYYQSERMGSTDTRTEQFSLKGPTMAPNHCVPLLRHPGVLLTFSATLWYQEVFSVQMRCTSLTQETFQTKPEKQ